MKTPDSIKIFPNVIPDDVCDYFVEKLHNEKNKRLSSWFDTPQSFVIDDPELDIEEQDFIEERANDFLQKCATAFNDPSPESLFFVAGWLTYWPNGTSMNIHVDNWGEEDKTRNLVYSGVLYLNDNFEGGEIYFPNLEGFTYKPQKGSLIAFPCEPFNKDYDQRDAFYFPHLHGIKLIESGERYTLSLWAAK